MAGGGNGGRRGGKQGMALQYNLKNLEGRASTKPSTSSATVKPGLSNQYATLDDTSGQQASYMAAEDVFSDLTVSNHQGKEGGHRMKITPLYVPGSHDKTNISAAQRPRN